MYKTTISIRDFIVAGSFTQIVWKNTTHLGLAVLQEKKYYIIVAIYFPRGNISGEYMDNVMEIHNDDKINNSLT